MPLARIAIVGRPNVGKSSLVNRLVGRRVSIVDPTPGVTRDRVTTLIEIKPPTDTPRGTPSKMAEIVDTGGWGVYMAEGKRFNDVGADLADLTPEIESQIRAAMQQADIVLFLLDAQSGITSLDQTVATLLRQQGDAGKVMVVANKVDAENWLADGLEMAGLGFGEPMCVSATTGFGMRELREAVYERLPHDSSEEATTGEMKLAIVGRRNAGKSSLINALAGEERVIVSEIAGTTRDSIDVRFEIEGRKMTAIDTAGLRKRKSFEDDIEYYAYHRMLSAIRRADVVLLLLDASEDVSQVDQQLAQELQRQFKPVVIVVNKWDLAEQKKVTPEDYEQYLTEQLRGLDYAPIVFISAKTGDGVRDAVVMAFNLFQQAGHRETTGKLNAAIKKVLAQRGPSSKLGTVAKVLYVSQVAVHPPTIVLIVNDPKLFMGRYEVYLLNRLREELPFSEVPIRLLFRQRQRMGLEEMKSRARGRITE